MSVTQFKNRAIDVFRTSTAAIIVNRVVRVGAVAATVKHTTGTSGRLVLGVALSGATGAGKQVAVRIFGVADVEASSKAVVAGAGLRATSGAASTSTRLGGTLKQSTSAIPNHAGIALTSAAAGTGKRLISVFINPSINSGLVL
jgi:hypothetical protein